MLLVICMAVHIGFGEFEGVRRAEVVCLLRDLMRSCGSFGSVPAVFIMKDCGADGYFLRAKWVPDASEVGRLNDIKLRYHVEMFEDEGYTVFRKLG